MLHSPEKRCACVPSVCSVLWYLVLFHSRFTRWWLFLIDGKKPWDRTCFLASPAWHKYHYLSVLCNTASVNPYFTAPYQLWQILSYSYGDGWDQGICPTASSQHVQHNYIRPCACLLQCEWRHWTQRSFFTKSLISLTLYASGHYETWHISRIHSRVRFLASDKLRNVF